MSPFECKNWKVSSRFVIASLYEVTFNVRMKSPSSSSQNENAIAVVKDEIVVGHIPKGLASTKQGVGLIKHFLMKTGSEAEVKVVGKAVNRGGGYGMEVLCIYKFQGHKIYVDLLKTLMDIDNNLSVRHETRKTL